MVRGAAKRAVIVRPADSKLFEQAIFIVAEEGVASGMSQGDLLQEARRIAGCYAPRARRKKSPAPGWMFAAGAGLTGCLWAAFLFLF